MIVVRTVGEFRRALASRAAAGRRGFVPTMGALHAGHTALFDAARRECAVVTVSIFVNARQFNDPADLESYPRVLESDAARCRAAGVDVLFAPAHAEIYPEGDVTTITVGGPAEGFEGAARPGHFAGVATVCAKLFAMVQPAAVYLGQKDAQQVAVLRQMTTDLRLDVDVRVVATVRDADGVALSSRNTRLSPDERARAAAIPAALRAAVAAHRAGADATAAARQALAGLHVEYVGIAPFAGDPTLVMAVRLGATRLIDNVPLDEPARAGL